MIDTKLSAVHFIRFAIASSFSRKLTANKAFVKWSINLRRYPVKNPDTPPPCLKIVLKVFKYVDVGSTFSICVFTQSSGITIAVLTRATQRDPGSRSLVGIASFWWMPWIFLIAYLMKRSVCRKTAHETACLMNKGVNPRKSSWNRFPCVFLKNCLNDV